MNYLRVVNFERYQHYKDRKPPWVKLYRDLWGNPDFFVLSESDRYIVISFFVVASQHDNLIPENVKWLQREMCTNRKLPLDSLVLSGWLERIDSEQAASIMLAIRARSRETEGETETEGDPPSPPQVEIPKIGFGEFKSVILSPEEEQKLRARLNGKFQNYIDRLDRYSQTDPRKFKKYKSHYAVILNWADRDGDGKGETGYRLA